MDREQVHQNSSNVCDIPRRHVFEQNGIISTRIEHWASARYSSVPHNTADIQTASPTVAPQTIGEGLVTFHRKTKPKEIRFKALMPSNSKPCWSGAPFVPLNADEETSKLLRTMKDARKHSHIKILVGGNNNTWITFSELAYAQRVEGRNRRDELSTRGQVYDRRHGVTAPQEPQYTDAEQEEFHMFELRESRKEMKSRGGTPTSWHRMYIGTLSPWKRGGSWSCLWHGEVRCADSLSARRLPPDPLLPGIAAGYCG
ncbi:hypothetical protein Q7P35_008228 [Cladosporium inversicolor]